MEIINGIKYRVHPTPEMANILSQWIGHQRFIYNAKVGEDKYFRTFSRKSLSLAGIKPPVDQKYSQFITEQTPFLKEVPSIILRNGVYRWMTGQQRFYKGLAHRPVIKKKHGRQSVFITSELFRFNPDKDELTLGTAAHPIGVIEYTRHGDKLAEPKSICIARHAGKWWLSFNYTEEINIDEEPMSEQELLKLFATMTPEELLEIAEGLDRGVAIQVASSEGVDHNIDPVVKARIAHKDELRKKYQRRYERQTKGSKRSLKTKKKIDATHEYQGNARNDFAHKTSRKLVDGKNSIFVFEDLKIQNMTKRAKPKKDEATGKFIKNGAAAKSGLNRVILGSAWSKVLAYTKYKGLRKNKVTIKIKPNGTSQECSKCGHTHSDNRETQSLFICKSCGLEINADYNASLVIKKRGVTAIKAEITLKQKKTVKFTKLASTRDGSPDVKRASDATKSEGPVLLRTGDIHKTLAGSPVCAGVYEPRNPHLNYISS